MQLGMIGLGRMGANMVRRLTLAGHECVGYDIDPAAVAQLDGADGGVGATTPEALVAALTPPRHVWLMVPSGYVGTTIDVLAPLLDRGDTIVDGGNSWFRDAADRAGRLAEEHGLAYVDVGTSGGVHGFARGYCLMVGGENEAVQRLTPIFETLAPGVDAAPRNPSLAAAGEPSAAERGWLHCGPPGAGHFVKMVHNGIEYGMMAAYAEGLNVLERADVGVAGREVPAETAALTHPEYYRYDFDLAAITEVWRRGSVVTSWLLDLTAEALADDPHLDGYSGTVGDSGEGRWTIDAAVDEGVPVPVLAASVFQRFSSRGRASMADRVLSAMRAGFGGHAESPAPPAE